MLRRAVAVVTFLSLLLCVLSVTLGLRGIWKHDRIQVRVAGRALGLNSQSGRLSLWVGSEAAAGFGARWRSIDLGEVESLQPWESDAPGPVSSKWYAAGFGHVRGWYPAAPDSSKKARYQMLVAPAWAAALLTALLPAWVLPRRWRDWRRRRRTARGRCHACGYDVRNSPDRCPECGTPTLHEARGAV